MAGGRDSYNLETKRLAEQRRELEEQLALKQDAMIRAEAAEQAAAQEEIEALEAELRRISDQEIADQRQQEAAQKQQQRDEERLRMRRELEKENREKAEQAQKERNAQQNTNDAIQNRQNQFQDAEHGRQPYRKQTQNGQDVTDPGGTRRTAYTDGRGKKSTANAKHPRQARAIQEQGGKAAQKATRSAGRAAGRAASQAAKQAARVAAQVARQIAMMIARAAMQATVALLANPWTWVVILVIGIIFLLIFAFAGFGQQEKGPAGREPVVAATMTQEDAKVKRLVALAGDLKAREELIEEIADETLAILTDKNNPENKALEAEIATKKPEEQQKIRAQIKKVVEKAENLKRAVEKAVKQNEVTSKGGKKKFPKYVLWARNDLVTELKGLEKFLGVSCDNLPAPNQWGMVKLPQSNAYGQSYQPTAFKWGTPKMVCFLTKVGDEIQKKYPGHKLEVLDLSNERGGTPVGERGPRHSTHYDGKYADLWILGGTIENNDKPYNPQLARDLAEIMRKNGATVVLFNDSTLNQEGLTTFWSGHYDHWHIQIR